MHSMIQRQVKLFGYIIRMKDDRKLKQLLFEEIDRVRFRGRPNMQWIDCIIEDLKTFNISNNPKEEWTKIGNFTLDRDKWKSFIEGEGMNYISYEYILKLTHILGAMNNALNDTTSSEVIWLYH